MRSKAASLHPLLIILAVALVSVLFVVSCGSSADPTAVPTAADDSGAAAAEAAAAAAAGAAEAAAVEAAAAELAELAAAEAAAGTPKFGGKLKVAMYANHLTLDPPMTGLSITDIFVTQGAYDNLLMIQPDLSVKPELATSWEPNANLTSYTFHLRKGVTFHHGKEFKAEDVVFTFERLLDPTIDSPARSTYEPVIDEIVALDDYTVRFDLKGPNAFFLDTISIYQARILPSDVDPDRFVLEEFGTGPFKIVDHLPGERTTLVPYEDYWQEGYPYLDELEVQYIPEVATRDLTLQAGDVDIVYMLEPQSVSTVEDHPDTTVLFRPSLSWMGIYMKVDTPPWDNKLVRKAMQAATDREFTNQAALFGLGAVAYDHPVPASDPLFAPQHLPPDYDPELARSLLEQAGYPDGIDVTLHYADVSPGLEGMALAFAETAAPTGIRITLEKRTADGFWTDVWNVEPFSVGSWFGRPNPDQALSIQIMSGVPWNTPNYDNPVLDELIIKARGETLEDQKVTYAEIQRILIDDVPRIIVAYRPWVYGARNNVRGVEPHPLSWPIFQDAWIDE